MMVRRARGFTLVEAIVVMVITAILAGVMVLFIRRPVQSYVDTAARADMADVAEIALRRMSRELHGAVPNSIRLSAVGGVSLLEFIPSVAGGRYLDVSDGTDPTDLNLPALSFTNANALRFYVVTPMPVAPYAIAPGDAIIVYNLGSGITGSDAYENNAANRATVGQVDVNGRVITMTAPNRFVNGATSSPSKRFIVARAPVTFACVDNANGTGTLTRYTNYNFRANQPDLAMLTANASAALMADNVRGCSFTVQQLANRNTALIGIAIALARPSPGSGGNGLETATLAQQIQVNNTP
ncbi:MULTISPECIES: type II secretion system protein [unclassified Duganella]|uniref:type II secretion system protein n=1 Tax=unclassified Duganella TaxID=2636909 RepID=UPI001587F6F6|nr:MULTISPECIES: type II secretion system protein [unclassified Duganella]